MNGQKLRELREARGLTRKQVEQATGLDRTLIARYEYTSPENPMAAAIVKLARFFGVEPEELLEGK